LLDLIINRLVGDVIGPVGLLPKIILAHASKLPVSVAVPIDVRFVDKFQSTCLRQFTGPRSFAHSGLSIGSLGARD
jgi:hypothetical protein